MRRLRRKYYDIFSHFYDAIISLHSQDKRAYLRRLIVEKSRAPRGGRLLDLCTGTGSVAICAAEMLGPESLVVGVDFSQGMLNKAREKALKQGLSNVYFVLADVASIPFSGASFDAVICSHAMYELLPETREACFAEVKRVLKPGGVFAMMEHCEPKHPFIRMLYYIRLASMGSPENRAFARDEVPFFKRFFKKVTKELTPTGGSKIILGINE